MWTQRRGSLSKAVDCLRFSSHRTLSFSSIGTRVELIFFFSALQPLNFFRVHAFTAAIPSGSPSRVTTRLECKRIPHTVCSRGRPSCPFLPPYGRQVTPIACFFSRWKDNSVVSCSTSTIPGVAWKRSRVAWKCPARISASLTRSFAKKPFVPAQSWQAIGILSPTPSASRATRVLNRFPKRTSANAHPASS
jgi:hypothetical protein